MNKSLEATLQKFGKGLRKNAKKNIAVTPDFGNADRIRAGKTANPGQDESVLRSKLRANRTKKK